jgi:uncharacterized protein (TIGR02099 family)
VTPFAVRFGRFILWIVVFFTVTLAVAVTSLRIALPKIDQFQPEIEAFISDYSGMKVDIGRVSGYWKNTFPSLSLEDISVQQDQQVDDFYIGQVVIRLDIVKSILTFQPQLSELTIADVEFDIRNLGQVDETSSEEAESQRGVDGLESLFFRRLHEFSLTDSVVYFSGIDGSDQQVQIEQVKWRNTGDRHQVQGILSTSEVDARSVEVLADFESQHGLRDMTGDFYLSLHSLQLDHLIAPYVAENIEVEEAVVSANGWLRLENNQPVDAYIDMQPSELSWSTELQENSLVIETGTLKLEPLIQGLKVSASDFVARTNSVEWSGLDAAFKWQPEFFTVNLSSVSLESLTPLVKLIPQSEELQATLNALAPKGEVEDIRVSMSDGIDSLRYSASLKNASMNQWELLPGFSSLSAELAGTADFARAKLTFIDDVLPYGDVFQAPLNIRHGFADVVWQQDQHGWRLWSEKVTAATPELQVLGAFRLDFPTDKPAFLSFYGEADLQNAGETWRYLPTLALGRSLTDYLSAAIQGGKVKTSKLLWYGQLSDFPYAQNDGVFQAWVPLQQAQFSFSTDWPAITQLQLDLLFENDAMYLDSRQADLMDVDATLIQGKIPELSSDGHIEILAAATANGRKVRDYMLATPLVDSVGATLTTIDIDSRVNAQFQLDIPFDTNKESRAWGYAKLLGNDIVINTPEMHLKNAIGTIKFDNDVVSSTGLIAELLGQPISLDFAGEQQPRGYAVNIDVIGDWDADPLGDYIGQTWIKPLKGHVPWNMGVDLQINDVGFTYQIDTNADLTFLASEYPAPLAHSFGEKGKASMQASGDQQSISARLQLPDFKFQTEIDITGEIPVLEATNWVLGNGGFKVSPIVGHHAAVRMPAFDLDAWLDVISQPQASGDVSILSEMKTPEVPKPLRVQLSTPNLQAGELEWNDVEFLARKRTNRWSAELESAQSTGKLEWLDSNKLDVYLERLNIYFPEFELDDDKTPEVPKLDKDKPLISDFDRAFFAQAPDTTIRIDDFWVQGYKVGEVDVEVVKSDNTLNWKRIDVVSGDSQLNVDGTWTLDGETSHSAFNLLLDSENNSDIMARFGFRNGIQRAPFNMNSELSWDGSPWGMKIDTLNGKVESEMGRGVISGVGGAAKFLGLFSFDSLVRRLQLDFSDVFDEGLAFDSIKGTGKIENGIFLTNDLKMDAISGDMSIRGLVNLNTEIIDAQATFKPDLTSGIPALTAFAITPQTALYVLAVTTVIAPVVEVITQVTYGIEGPMNDPQIKEQSRQKGDFEIPEEYRKQSK